MQRIRYSRIGISAVCVCLLLTMQVRAQVIFEANFGSSDGGFTVTNGIGAGVPAGPWTYDGAGGNWFANGGEGVVNSALDSPLITVSTAGTYALSVNHRYLFEDDGTIRWDAGQIHVSLNGSDYAPVNANAFIVEGYATDRTIRGNSPPLNGQFAFNGRSTGYDVGTHITSVANLGSLEVDDQLSVRFIGAWDEGFIEPAPNWEIGSVEVVASEGLPPLPEYRQNSLNYEVYSGIGGVLISDLRNSPNFPDNPDITDTVAISEIPVDRFDNYGARLSGYFTPDETGLYDFYMSSDDAGELHLSTDADPANAVLIANEPVWNPSRQYSGTDRRNAAAPENRSTTLFPEGIPLLAGQSYYVEALMKEGGGGDNLSFTAALRTDPLTPDPIPTSPLGSAACNCGATDIGLLSTSPIPEPTALGLVLLGFPGLMLLRRRRSR